MSPWVSKHLYELTRMRVESDMAADAIAAEVERYRPGCEPYGVDMWSLRALWRSYSRLLAMIADEAER